MRLLSLRNLDRDVIEKEDIKDKDLVFESVKNIFYSTSNKNKIKLVINQKIKKLDLKKKKLLQYKEKYNEIISQLNNIINSMNDDLEKSVKSLKRNLEGGNED